MSEPVVMAIKRANGECSPQPLHGGDLPFAANYYGIEQHKWLDLSTGINPQAYPVAEIPSEVFAHLPYRQSAFTEAVIDYYGSENFLSVSGTQSAIQQLPNLLNKKNSYPVLLPSLGYSEHQQHWLKAGNSAAFYCAESGEKMLADIDQQLAKNSRQHLVIINPNNPTTVQVTAQQLLYWAAQLSGDAKLIVDEAFIDASENISLLQLTDIDDALKEKLIVLRSFGKFFGLAGLRIGFVFASPEIVRDLQQELGIWQINGPAQWLATQAYRDRDWQQQARTSLQQNIDQTLALFHPLIEQLKLQSAGVTNYFFSLYCPLALAGFIQDFLARQAVLIRLIEVDDQRAMLRVGAFDVQQQAQRMQLQQALAALQAAL
ncbi:aminotransferase class I/II-fold pyridoxal phosphate-dependent enzyme [Reinekea thalattae]|uniref:Aminotransferase n=1 Tax=Reinekea thalattae TaxID=2593301 RepID=A0A5C8Z911_9GAMM|nr:aminotransferase class I/II-fold pyridoxal phosphate-dependent enzyme [Reinekea thalattae]TXR53641.1 aminotransferase class I/II-fold pyridoxal phosphate-dependent enzyme [Reinekea thalattae]